MALNRTKLVFLALYEGGQWIVVDATNGAQTTLPAFPEFSEKGTLLAVFLNDALSGQSGIEISRRVGGVFVKEYSGVPSLRNEIARANSYSITSLESWLSECAIAVRTDTYVGSERTPSVEHLIIRRHDGAWKVERNDGAQQ